MIFIVCLLCLNLELRISAEELPPEVPKIRYAPDMLYSEEGFRLGFIITFEHDIFWHYEGTLMMGSGSNPVVITDQNCVHEKTTSAQLMRNPQRQQTALGKVNNQCAIDKNPWSFSVVNSALFNAFSDASIGPVVVYYTRSIDRPVGVFSNGSLSALFTSTVNYVKKIWPVNPNFEVPEHYMINRGELPIAEAVNPAEGVIEGRVVKASMDHLLFKTYEVTIQAGEDSSNFERMSVDDAKMFDHLVLTMLSGKIVRIRYVRLFELEGDFFSAVRGYSTNFRITGVDLSPEQRPMRQYQP